MPHIFIWKNKHKISQIFQIIIIHIIIFLFTFYYLQLLDKSVIRNE